jgi:hypothetical protein
LREGKGEGCEREEACEDRVREREGIGGLERGMKESKTGENQPGQGDSEQDRHDKSERKREATA